jgi:excisionase family DNA binding protein
MTRKRKEGESPPKLVVVKLEPLLCSPAEGAKLLACSESTLRKLIKDGHLESLKVGASRKIVVESIKDYIASNTEHHARPKALRPHEVGDTLDE